VCACTVCVQVLDEQLGPGRVLYGEGGGEGCGFRPYTSTGCHSINKAQAGHSALNTGDELLYSTILYNVPSARAQSAHSALAAVDVLDVLTTNGWLGVLVFALGGHSWVMESMQNKSRSTNS
jgi:hypothetical protein